MTTAITMTVDGFFSAVKNADRYYSFSDDASVYRAGKNRMDQLATIAKTLGGVYTQIWNAFTMYDNAVMGGNKHAREPQWKDFIAPEIPTLDCVRGATQEELQAYVTAHPRTADMEDVLKNMSPGTPAELKTFMDNVLYDPQIKRVKFWMQHGMAIYLPTKGTKGGNAYVTVAGRSRTDVFNSVAQLKAWLLKYYF